MNHFGLAWDGKLAGLPRLAQGKAKDVEGVGRLGAAAKANRQIHRSIGQNGVEAIVRLEGHRGLLGCLVRPVAQGVAALPAELGGSHAELCGQRALIRNPVASIPRPAKKVLRNRPRKIGGGVHCVSFCPWEGGRGE